MNDLDLVLATLMSAIHALQTRETHLTSLEKKKLRALQLNLEAARGAATMPAEMHPLPAYQ